MGLDYFIKPPNNKSNEGTCIEKSVGIRAAGSVNRTHEVACMRHVNNKFISHPDSRISTGWETIVTILYLNTIHSLKRYRIIKELTAVADAATEIDF